MLKLISGFENSYWISSVTYMLMIDLLYFCRILLVWKETSASAKEPVCGIPNFTTVCVSVCVRAHAHVYVCVHACGGKRPTSGVFCCSSFYSLRQSLLLDPELYWLTRGLPLSPTLSTQTHTTVASFVYGVRDLNSDLDICMTSTLLSPSHLPTPPNLFYIFDFSGFP